MDRTKEKVYEKRKLWKIFTLKRPQFLQKMLAVGVSASLILSMAPKIGVFAADEPTTFITAAKANHWGRSDLRAYLNGVKKEDNTLPLETTHDTRQTSGYYESQFSDTEYALVQPFKYHTNVFVASSQAGSVTSYATTDRFGLPSGNISSGSDKVLSWGATDVSLNSSYESLDSARAIPISYWPAGASSYSWLRSPRYDDDRAALGASRGRDVISKYVNHHVAAAAAFKLDLSSVIFASAASAASLVPAGAASGSRKFKIEGSSDFGKQVTAKLPDYGMYLKQGSEESFEATGLSYSNGSLTVNYSGGAEDQFVVVQAFRQFSDDAETGDLVKGTTSYEAAAPLSAGQPSATLEVSSWGLSSLDGYTIKVWMEDASGGSSLAAATKPATFSTRKVDGSGAMVPITDSDPVSSTDTTLLLDALPQNKRVFAEVGSLQTSWGDLQALKTSNETAYNNVIAGKGQDGSDGGSTNSIHGLNPTNQKIYFGTAADGSPLEFWIAGRETYAGDPAVLDGDGEISADGEIMTLYQAKSVETKPFNASYSNYDGNKKSVTLQLADGLTGGLSAGSVVYPTDKVTAKVVDSSSGSSEEMAIPFDDLGWQHRAQGATAWNDGMPTAVGTYRLRCYAPGVTDSYERTYSSIVTFNVKYAPQVSDFTFSPPTDLTYDGNQKTAAVTTEQSGMGDITVKYYKEDGTTTAPTDVGTYTVKIDVAAGETYNSASDLDGGWTFEIVPAVPTYSAPSLTSLPAIYGQTLGDVALDQEALGAPQFGGRTISGTWSWENAHSTSVGDVDTNPFKAKFTPNKDFTGDNFDWINASVSGEGAEKENGVIKVNVPVAVQPLPVNIKTIKIVDDGLAYNGSAQTPTITIEDTYNKSLTLGSDYTVEYGGDQISAGTQPITIKFQGNYASDADNDGAADNPDNGVTLSYKIKPATLTVDSITADDKIYDGTADATAAVTLSGARNGETLSQGTDFEVAAQFVDGAGNSDANVGTNKKVKAKITLTSDKAKNYTFADDGTELNTITETTDPSAEIKPFDISSAAVKLADSRLTYTGSALKPGVSSVKVKLDGTTDTPLDKDTDYTVSYNDNTNAGIATVTITGTGNFEGTQTANFTINKKSLAGAYIAVDPSEVTFNGASFEPEVTVTLAGFSKPLIKDTDYTVSYNDNTNAGTATVTITGTGNFTDSANTTFTITKAAPNPKNLHENPTLSATYGQTLGDIKAGLASAIGSFLGVDSTALKGVWAWEKDAETPVGNVGENNFTAIFTPDDKNYSTANVGVAVDVAQAPPDNSKLTPSPTLEATYGQTLGDIKEGLASAIGSVLGVDDQELEGVWAWEKVDATTVGDVGKNPFTALFKPTDTSNYAWTTLDGWDADKEALVVDVTVKVSVDTSKWGEAQKRDADGKTQYVESSGKTSIELTKNNLSEGDVLWLLEESGGTHAWYGIDLSSGAFDLDKGLRFYVQWLSPKDADYNTYYSQLDDAQKARVEGDNGWIFLISVEDPDGNKVQPAQPAKVYVQLGDPNEGADWDLEHLKAYYITSGGDENVPVEDVPNFAYPGGTDEFGMMTLSHFSPYFIFDELTDEEKAALELKPEDGNHHPADEPDSSGTDLPSTGDISTELLFSGLAIVLVSSLGVMLRLITNKKKFEE